MMDTIAQVLHAAPVTDPDALPSGAIIEALCEDGQTRLGMYLRGSDGTGYLVLLSQEIPLGPKPTPRKRRPIDKP